MSAPDTTRQEPPKEPVTAAEVEALVAALPRLLTRYLPVGLASVIETALLSLRDYVEDPAETEVTWANPWVEARLVAPDYNWDRPDEDIFSLRLLLDTKDREAVVRAWMEGAAWAIQSHALYVLTHRAHWRTCGGTSTLYLPPEEVARLAALPDAECQEAERALVAPVTFGAFSLDANVSDEGPVSPGLAAALQAGLDACRPGLAFEGTTDAGEAFAGTVVLQFHPLVADEDAHLAFFPLVVGVEFFPRETELKEGQDPTVPDPSTWSDADRAAFWKALLDEYHAQTATLADKAFSTRADLPAAEAGPERAAVAAAPPPAAEPAGATGGMFWNANAYWGHGPIPTGPVPAERRPTFPLAFGHTIADAEVLDLLRHVHRVRLPARKWSTLPSWFDLRDRERDRLLAEEGDRAFEDLKRTTGDPDARGPLLKRHHRSNGEVVVSLTVQAERDLKVREGLGKGFRYVDPKSFGKEYFVRLFQAGSGFVEVGFSWLGLAGPWVEEWRTELERQTKAAERNAPQLSLFDRLDAERRAEVDRLVQRLHMVQDSRRLMEAVVGQVYKQGSTEVRVPAVAFRELLKLHGDPNWKGRVEGGLQALRACEFRVDSFGGVQKVKAYGAFLAEWRYRGAGPGDHGDGDYFLAVSPTFLGCLRAFESDRRKLPSGTEVLRLDFGKKLTDEDKAAHGWGYDRKARERRTPESRFVDFDAGRAFYHAAAGFTPYQENLAEFLERELTRRDAPVSRTLGAYAARKTAQASPRAPDARAPRVYTHADCPLLAEGTRYHAALGNFRRNPEAGRTLYGTRRRESATGGRHAEGLLAVMGYNLRPGGAVQDRRRVVQAALQDLKAVVVEYFGGVVAARHTGRWLPLAEAAALNEDDLGKRVRWALFVPETWTADRRRRWEEATGWTATETPQGVDHARLALRNQDAVPSSGDATPADLPPLPLRLRLQIARNTRKLTTRQVAPLFGVSRQAYETWEHGTDPDPDTGKVRGKPIPEEMVPLVVRWVETGEAPTPAELAARRTRRSGVKSTSTASAPDA